MTFLLLGGTLDARRLAARMHGRGLDVLYSVAGIVRPPQVPVPVRCGGFSAHGGLAAWLRRHPQVGCIIDATHPYAARISGAAVRAADELGLPCLRLHRPPWEPLPDERPWQLFGDYGELACGLLASGARRVFLSTGQVPQSLLDGLESLPLVLLRTAVASSCRLPDNCTWVRALGPFGLAAERELIARHGIDSLVSKNSGSPAVFAKIRAARERGLALWMMRRPPLAAARQYSRASDMLRACRALAARAA